MASQLDRSKSSRSSNIAEQRLGVCLDNHMVELLIVKTRLMFHLCNMTCVQLFIIRRRDCAIAGWSCNLTPRLFTM